MKKIVRITENDLTRIVKMVIKEQSGSPVKKNHYNQYKHNTKSKKKYPEIKIDENKSGSEYITFQEGEYKIDNKTKNDLLNNPKIVNPLKKYMMVFEEYGNYQSVYEAFKKITPKFITIEVQTTSTDGRDIKELGNKRANSMKHLIFHLFGELGRLRENMINIDRDLIESAITINTKLSSLPNGSNGDNLGLINVKYINVAVPSLEDKSVTSIEDNLRKAKGMNFNPDEHKIMRQIQKLKSFSDIVNLNNKLKDQGGLEGFLNSTIEDSMLFGDDEERRRIVWAINNASMKSAKGSIAKIEGNVRDKTSKVLINIDNHL